jgi:hypothetical protein
MQKEALSAQCLPASHKPEQQSPFAAHSLPAVLQLELSAVHVLSAPQLPPQHSSFVVHAWPSDTHCSVEHFPPTQLSEQQSDATAQELPAPAQVVTADTQPVFGSHTPEQQSGPPWQELPTVRHESSAPPAPLVLPVESNPAWPNPALPLGPLAAPPPLASSDGLLELPPQPTHRAPEVISKAAKIRVIRMPSLRE